MPRCPARASPSDPREPEIARIASAATRSQSIAVTSAPWSSASKLNHPSHAPMSSTRFPVRSAGTGNRAYRFRSHSISIDRRYLGAVELRFEAEPPVPCPDVQHALPRQIRGNRKSRVSLPQPLDLVEALDPLTVRQLETVIPALLGKLLAEVLAPAGFLHMLDYTGVTE